MPSISPITLKMYETEDGGYSSIQSTLLYDVNNEPLFDVNGLRLIVANG